ncbi:SRPBCC family protein [Lentzea sp. NPDC058450]|uniref:SRPBCC family protein n=1 Tax=Lentzea sp. NPDC058450 TaxID=3346505 RepID=UPI00365E8D73
MTEVHWPPGWGPEQCDSFVSCERLVAAAPEALFDHLTAVGEWPKWQRGTAEVQIDGELSVGSGFVVATALNTLDGIVGELDRPERFGWIAVSDGLSFYQSWLLLPDAGGTRVVFEEAARGPSATLRAAERLDQTKEWLASLDIVRYRDYHDE